MTNTYSEEVKLVAKAGEIPFSKGLEGIPVGESTKSFVDGLGGKLVYHGHSIEELCEKSTYEEVFYLLLHDRLPKESELKDLGRLMRSYREIPAELYDLIAKQAPRYGVHSMSVLRTAVSALAAYDETTEDDTPTRTMPAEHPDRLQDRDHRRRDRPRPAGQADALPALRPLPRRQFLLHADRERPRQLLRGIDGRAADPARGSRMQRQHLRRGDRPLDAQRPVFGGGGGDLRAEGAAARRRQRRSHADAAGDRIPGQRRALPRGRDVAEAAHPRVRPPRLQDHGSARGDPAATRRARSPAAPEPSTGWRPPNGSRRSWPRNTASAESGRTWISSPAS